MTDKMETESDQNILKKVNDNHIWLNAFSCINPTDDFKKEVGAEVIYMLSQKDRLLKAKNGINDLLYLMINKS